MPQTFNFGFRNSCPKIYTFPVPVEKYVGLEGRLDEGKPSIDEVIAYAHRTAVRYISHKNTGLPHEQREEIQQDAMLRVIRIYPRIENKGWKSFIQKHIMGVSKDYYKTGSGFEENKTLCHKKKLDPALDDFESLAYRISNHLESQGLEEPAQDIETILAQNGVNAVEEFSLPICPNWPLLSRMARKDEDLRLVGKLLAGFTHTALSAEFGITRERLSQKVREFFARLDAPEGVGDSWIEQCIFALGLCEYFGMPNKDLKIGWEYDPVDMKVTEAPTFYSADQLSFF